MTTLPVDFEERLAEVVAMEVLTVSVVVCSRVVGGRLSLVLVILVVVIGVVPGLPALVVLLISVDSLKRVLLEVDEISWLELVERSDNVEDCVDEVLETSVVKLDPVGPDVRKL